MVPVSRACKTGSKGERYENERVQRYDDDQNPDRISIARCCVCKNADVNEQIGDLDKTRSSIAGHVGEQAILPQVKVVFMLVIQRGFVDSN